MGELRGNKCWHVFECKRSPCAIFDRFQSKLFTKIAFIHRTPRPINSKLRWTYNRFVRKILQCTLFTATYTSPNYDFRLWPNRTIRPNAVIRLSFSHSGRELAARKTSQGRGTTVPVGLRSVTAHIRRLLRGRDGQGRFGSFERPSQAWSRRVMYDRRQGWPPRAR